jgi:hypothetical protein
MCVAETCELLSKHAVLEAARLQGPTICLPSCLTMLMVCTMHLPAFTLVWLRLTGKSRLLYTRGSPLQDRQAQGQNLRAHECDLQGRSVHLAGSSAYTHSWLWQDRARQGNCPCSCFAW